MGITGKTSCLGTYGQVRTPRITLLYRETFHLITNLGSYFSENYKAKISPDRNHRFLLILSQLGRRSQLEGWGPSCFAPCLRKDSPIFITIVGKGLKSNTIVSQGRFMQSFMFSGNAHKRNANWGRSGSSRNLSIFPSIFLDLLKKKFMDDRCSSNDKYFIYTDKE